MKHTDELSKICRHLNQNELGIWLATQSEKCFYPEDGEKRFVGIEDDSFWFGHRRNCIIEIVKKYPPDGLIIDVGGGNGFVTLAMKQAGFNAVLLEPNIKAAMNAFRRGITQIICSTLDSAQFDAGSIGALGLFDVIEHIENDMAFLKTIRKLLKTKGKLYLTVPAFPSLWSAEDRYARHFRRYTLRLITKQLRQCGFEIDHATYLFSYLPLPLFLVKTLPTELGWARTYTHEQTRREHVLQPGLKKKVLDGIHTWERHMIKTGKTIPFGTSILVSAYAS